jgi:hypothetical protein
MDVPSSSLQMHITSVTDGCSNGTYGYIVVDKSVLATSVQTYTHMSYMLESTSLDDLHLKSLTDVLSISLYMTLQVIANGRYNGANGYISAYTLIHEYFISGMIIHGVSCVNT